MSRLAMLAMLAMLAIFNFSVRGGICIPLRYRKVVKVVKVVKMVKVIVLAMFLAIFTGGLRE